MTAVDLDAIEVRAAKLESFADQEATGLRGPAYTTGVALVATLSAADVPALVAEVRRLRAKLDQDCGSCHPCTNYADQTWRDAGRKPPHVITWDDTREAMQRVAHLADQFEVAGDVETAQRIRKAMHIPDLYELLDQADAAASAEPPTDRELLAAVHRWARTNGWDVTWIGWANASWAGDATVVVEWDDEELTVRRRPASEVGRQWPSGLGSVGRSERYPVTSVREAVDILAALGVLPAELSSAWRAGRAAR